MKRILPCLVAFLFLLASSKKAHADNLTFLAPTNAVSGGEYIYPYNFSLNGSSNPISLMCLNLDRTIAAGESWAVTAESIPTGDAAMDIALRADAYIFSLLGQYSTSDVQWAVWSILDPTGVAHDSAYNATAADLATQGIAAANDPTRTASNFYDQFVIYAPTSDSTGWTNGIPQNLLGRAQVVTPPPSAATPEPGSITLLATGILGAGMLVMYRRRQQGDVFASTI